MIDLLVSQDPPLVTMYDNRSMRAFGPVVDGPNCVEVIADFIATMDDDPRTFTDWELAFKWVAFVADGGGGGTSPTPAPEDVPPATGDYVADAQLAATPDNARSTPETRANDNANVISGGAFGTQPNANPADATVSLIPDNAPAPRAREPITPAEMPIGARVCWACNGHREEPNRPGEPCGICGGSGWLPG